MAMFLRVFLVSAVLLFLIHHSEGEKVRGTLNLKENKGFAFVGKFCFRDHPTSNFSHTSPGAGTADIEFTNNHGHDLHFHLLFYDDQASSWPQIYGKGLSCHEMTSYEYRRSDHYVSLSPYESYDKTTPIRQHIRPRWWFIYIANCDDYSNFTAMDFEVHFTQNITSWWSKEIGANDHGLNVMYTAFVSVYMILFGVQLYAYYIYTIQQYIHQVIKLLTASVGLQLFAVLFYFGDWILFTGSGEHEIYLQIIARLCEIMSISVFLLLLMVLAQGWTVSHFEVFFPKTLLSSVIIIAIVQSVLYIWTLIGLDEESTTYIYNTTPQKIYGAVFIVIGLLFIAQCSISYRNEPLESKRSLYILLCVFFSCWFLWPLLRIFVGNAFEPWVRDTATQTISQLVHFIAVFVMMLLMWPKWAHNYFTLTVLDSQKSILESDANKQTDYNPLVLEQDRL